MAISSKISTKITQLNTSDAMKQLMRSILEIEDKGAAKPKEAYDEKVDKFIEDSGVEVNDD